MNFSQQIAKQFKELYYGENFAGTHLQQHLDGLTWEQATLRLHNCNSIHTLVFHIGYYVRIVTKVLEGGPLSGSDKLSYDHPAITSQEEWEQFLATTYEEVDLFASLVEQLPEEQLKEGFDTGKYGNYYRNLAGVIQHCNYHLGQIAILRKMIDAQGSKH